MLPYKRLYNIILLVHPDIKACGDNIIIYIISSTGIILNESSKGWAMSILRCISVFKRFYQIGNIILPTGK